MTVSLSDKYLATTGRVYLTGSQALVRLPLQQARRDAARGYKTAGFISGYRGSPLGGYDFALWDAGEHLKAADIHFKPGVNEDLAAAAVWGTQQVPLIGKALYEGVFSIWYGKGPGVDRSADALKHGNFAGSSSRGGVLVLCGDDHAAQSSTLAHQSDHALIHCGIPILNPADLQDYLDLGLFGFELSRYSGCWTGFKCVGDTVDSSSPVSVDPDRFIVQMPDDYISPPDGLSIRMEIAALAQEARLFEQRHLAAQAFARANRIDRQTLGPTGRKRLGIVSSGKAWRDVMEGLHRLGIGPEEASRSGIAVWKTAMVWPLEPERIRSFASQCDELLVIEEKRGVIEEQLANLLYNLPTDRRPRLIGKRDETGRPCLSAVGEIGPDDVVEVVRQRCKFFEQSDELRGLLAIAAQGQPADVGRAPVTVLAATQEQPVGVGAAPTAVRAPAYCAGCPHNTSTRVPDGSFAVAGIGCHGLAALMPERKTITGCHMGGEGAPWIGQEPFLEESHVFQNLGDGTYFHSGLLAIRACVAANVNITYKILLNGAVGMTGGQTIEGEAFSGTITAPHVAQQVFSEGVGRIALVTDDPGKFASIRGKFPAITTFHKRDQLDQVQRDLREWKGVSVLIYDQACATERRRLRKRGKIEDSDVRLYINSEVCEGCGDCGIQSNCIALEPIETEFGRKRRINQSVCNTDLSCLKGFCPSFVTVVGGELRGKNSQGHIDEVLAAPIEIPRLPATEGVYSILITGIGGNGVVTIGAILGMAAHIEERYCSVLDMSGVAQRNGSVMSHVRIAGAPDWQGAARIPGASADLVLGCDAIVAASPDSLKMIAPDGTIVLNSFVAPTKEFARNADFQVDVSLLKRRILAHIGDEGFHEADATGIASTLLGDAIGANMFLVGYGWQAGRIPLAKESIEAAIRLNGTAVEMNLRAFALGRLARANPQKLTELLGAVAPADSAVFEDLSALVRHRKQHLTAYQDKALANRYEALVDRVDRAERALGQSYNGLARSVARNYANLLAYKDEYEVARLFSQKKFREQLEATFTGNFHLRLNMAPPLLSRRNPETGRLGKREFGGWLFACFPLLAKMRRLRGTPLDPFGYSRHRQMERRLIVEFEKEIEHILEHLSSANHGEAVEIAELYGTVRGFDVVKEESVTAMHARLKGAREVFECTREVHQPAGVRSEAG